MALRKISAEISKARKVENKETGERTPHPYAGVRAEIQVDFGDTLEDLVAFCSGDKGEEHGKKVVFSNAVANMIVSPYQSGIRRLISLGKADTVQAWADSVIPGLAAERSRKSAKDKLKVAISGLQSEEDIAAALEYLKSKRAELKSS